MKIEIRLRGPLSSIMKEPIQSLEIQTGITVHELLLRLIRDYYVVQSRWNTPEDLDRDALILVNDVDIGVLSGLQTKLNDGDVVSLIPLVHGG